MSPNSLIRRFERKCWADQAGYMFICRSGSPRQISPTTDYLSAARPGPSNDMR